MKDWTPIILALIALVGGGGGIYSALTVGATRRKMIAEAASINANTTTVLGKSAVELLTPLRERIRELEAEVEELRDTVHSLTRQVAERDATIHALRGRPRPGRGHT